MPRKKKLNSGNDKRGRAFFQIDGKYVTKEKWLRASRAEATYLSRLDRIKRDELGRFARYHVPVAESPKGELSRIVLFYERIKNTRIRRLVQRTYPMSVSEEQIQADLMSQRQYEQGGNYVLNIVSISTGQLQPNTESELDRGPPGSADVSP